MIDINEFEVFLFDLMGTIVKEEHENEVITTPGLVEFLDLLKLENKKLGVVTSTTRERAHFLLKFLELDSYFDVIVTRDDVKDTKPAPKPYLKALEDLGVGNEGAVAFEDTVKGLTAAKEAGILTVYVTNGYPEIEAEEVADITVKNFSEILKELNTGLTEGL